MSIQSDLETGKLHINSVRCKCMAQPYFEINSEGQPECPYCHCKAYYEVITEKNGSHTISPFPPHITFIFADGIDVQDGRGKHDNSNERLDQRADRRVGSKPRVDS